MDKLKQTFSRGKNDEADETAGATGKVTGPGSHFRSAKEPTGLGTTAGSEMGTTSDPSASAAQYTTGPEAGGDHHIGTVDPSNMPGTTQENPTSGAVGETSTYSSTPLARGDPTSSVIYSESTDPLTYQKPEHLYTGAGGAGDTGVPEGAAAMAASKAYSGTAEVMPGSFPSQSQAQLDPSSTGLATSAATAAAAGQPAAPSTLTSTTSPGERLGDYREAEKSRGLDSAGTASESQPHSTMVEKVLGAVGLGSFAGAGAAKARSGNDDTAVADTPDQPTTTTGVTTHSVPQQSGPGSHHRKESIPTTAYPAGVDSPSPVAPPVGGTQPQEQSAETQRGYDNAALGAAAVGGAGLVGAGAYAAHGMGKDRETPSDTTVPATSNVARTEPLSATTPATTEIAPTSAISQPHVVSGTGPSTTEPATTTQPEKEEDHTRRNVVAAGAAGIGAGAAGAYGAHEYSQKKTEEEAAQRAAEQKEQARQQAEHQKELERQQADRQKELEKQQAERQKELDKQQKEAEKAAAKKEKEHQKEMEKQEKTAAKEEKKHQKEVEKEEKKHQKELEKEEKQHQKEVAAAEKQREEREELERKRVAEAEEEDRKRREKEAAAAAGVGAAGAGAATYAATRDDDPAQRTTTAGTAKDTKHDGGEVEKKPSLLKRIFKRTRKNKDTGEDEEYEEEGDEDDSHKGAAAAGVVGAGAAGAGAYYATRDDDKPTTTTDSTGKYEDTSGGFQKPSYNPFSKKDEPSQSTATTTGYGDQRETTATSHGADPTPATTTTTDRALDRHPATTTTTERRTDPTSTSATDPSLTSGADTTSSSEKPIEPITGLPYDPSKDPAAAKRIEEREHGAMELIEEAKRIREEKGEAGPGIAGDTSTSHGHGHGHATDTGTGSVGSGSDQQKRSLGTRLKEKLLPTGGPLKEDDKA